MIPGTDRPALRIGLAYDLQADQRSSGPQPEDALEEYDTPEMVALLGATLRRLGFGVVELGGGRSFLARLLAGPAPDLVFNLAEGRGSRSREAHVPACCEMLGVPVTHSDPLTMAVTLDKAMTKRVALAHGIPTAPFCLIERPEDLAGAALPPFPVIAKPNCEGSSMGVRRHSVCRDAAELAPLAAWILAEYRQPVLVESFLPGAEVTVVVLGDGAGARILGAMEIAPRQGGPDRFVYSLEVKRNYKAEVDYHVPPRLPPAALEAVDAVALASHRALGCRDIARIDLRLDAEGRPCLLEVNALPGLDTTHSDVPILCGYLGIGYDELIGRIVGHALDRHPGLGGIDEAAGSGHFPAVGA